MDLDQQMSKLKGKILKTLRAKALEEEPEADSKTDVLPMLKFRTKCGSTVYVNCYQIVGLSRIGLFKYSLLTQSRSWDISKSEYKRIIDKISKKK